MVEYCTKISKINIGSILNTIHFLLQTVQEHEISIKIINDMLYFHSEISPIKIEPCAPNNIQIKIVLFVCDKNQIVCDSAETDRQKTMFTPMFSMTCRPIRQKIVACALSIGTAYLKKVETILHHIICNTHNIRTHIASFIHSHNIISTYSMGTCNGWRRPNPTTKFTNIVAIDCINNTSASFDRLLLLNSKCNTNFTCCTIWENGDSCKILTCEAIAQLNAVLVNCATRPPPPNILTKVFLRSTKVKLSINIKWSPNVELLLSGPCNYPISPESFDYGFKQLIWLDSFFPKYYIFHFNLMCYIWPHMWVNCINTTKDQL